MASKVIVKNKFREATRAAHRSLHEATSAAVAVGRASAQSIVQERAASRGYQLSVKMGSEEWGYGGAFFPVSAVSSRWGTDPFYLAYFEYGTHHINAMPFMRPAAKLMAMKFDSEMATAFERRIRERVSV